MILVIWEHRNHDSCALHRHKNHDICVLNPQESWFFCLVKTITFPRSELFSGFREFWARMQDIPCTPELCFRTIKTFFLLPNGKFLGNFPFGARSVGPPPNGKFPRNFPFGGGWNEKSWFRAAVKSEILQFTLHQTEHYQGISCLVEVQLT